MLSNWLQAFWVSWRGPEEVYLQFIYVEFIGQKWFLLSFVMFSPLNFKMAPYERVGWWTCYLQSPTPKCRSCTLIIKTIFPKMQFAFWSVISQFLIGITWATVWEIILKVLSLNWVEKNTIFNFQHMCDCVSQLMKCCSVSSSISLEAYRLKQNISWLSHMKPL